MPDRVGQQLGNYRLLRLLGRGGFAEVYLGTNLYVEQISVAIKVLKTSLTTQKHQETFRAEAGALARLKHPHIVSLLDFGLDEQGIPFLVTEYASGTLRQRHPRGECLSLERTVAYVGQIAAALQYAHNHHMIHRDVKPENILLQSEYHLLLSDFGIAVFAPTPEEISTQDPVGSIRYMAPEQLNGKPGFASDQYSLGVVVYEWLCGVCPFEGNAVFQIAAQHLSASPPRLREKDPSLPEAVDSVVLRALAKEPQERYVSVQRFAQALEQASGLALPPDVQETRVLFPAAALPRRVFLVASPADQGLLAQLVAHLHTRGVSVCNPAPEPAAPPSDPELAARQAMRAADLVVLVATPETPASPVVKSQLDLARRYHRRVACLWAAGQHLADFRSLLEVGDVFIDARPGHAVGVLDQLLALFEGPPMQPHPGPVPPSPSGAPHNPYKGLQAFTERDAALFFGQEALVEELIGKVRGMLAPQAPGRAAVRFLPLLGPSGSGKSSVVMAGLLARLQQGALPGSQEWLYLERLVPGADPIESLVFALAAHFPGRTLKSLREDLEDPSGRGLHLLAKHLVQGSGRKVVLFVDQSEELFTRTTSEEKRQRFLGLLLLAMSEPQGNLIVILTLRADFYDRLFAYPELGRLVQIHHWVILPMGISDLQAVIERPVALPTVQVRFEAGLARDLLFEVYGQPGALPLLQFTLEQLFERRKDRVLTREAYQQIGGVKGALARQAEATYAALPSEEHRKLARALFLRLIDPGESEQDTTRRRAARSELLLPDAKQTALLQEVAAAFVAARLLTTNELGGTATLEVSHEAVIREWARLANWLREAREDIRLQQTVSRDAAEWQRRKQPADRLYRGSQLKEARAWARRNTPSGDEVAFLRASAARRVRAVAGVFVVLLLVLSSIGTAGWFLTHPVLPDPTHVTNLLDHGPGSLRQAIDTSPPGSTITFDAGLSGTIMLTSSDLNIAKNLTIRGPMAHPLAVSSGTSKHIVHVFRGVSQRPVKGFEVTISHLIFKGSKEAEFSFIVNEGILTLSNSTISGGISNEGDLRLTNSTVSGNSAQYGGGIYNGEGTLTLTNSTVSGNSAQQDDGGGIFNGGNLTLTNSTVSGNSSRGGRGGGIVNEGKLTLTNSTVSGNSAVNGGGIFNEGDLRLTNSTISGNSAGLGGGGGISNDIIGRLTLTNSTVSGNSSRGGGGGISNQGGRLTLNNSTVSGNSARDQGGGVEVTSQPYEVAQADITFSTISGNTAPVGADLAISDLSTPTQISPTQISQVKMRNSIIFGDPAHAGPDISGTLISSGYNLFQENSGATFDPSPKSTDQLVPVNDLAKVFASPVGLRNNGGPTKTLALAPGSPAIDAIPVEVCRQSGITADQRGVKRPQGKGCDIGAYEA